MLKPMPAPKLKYKGRRIYLTKPKEYDIFQYWHENWFDDCEHYIDYRLKFANDITLDKYGNAIY